MPAMPSKLSPLLRPAPPCRRGCWLRRGVAAAGAEQPERARVDAEFHEFLDFLDFLNFYKDFV